ncbi:MAG: hypothetical protein CVT95_10100 [Bacteroidetes bacterium HGW-Bacteroidetes-12]|nr:MAG: hypothetical protein CVT95_10100 [Bacteroidetes bacterium HGW-Bacteroidetes-12]
MNKLKFIAYSILVILLSSSIKATSQEVLDEEYIQNIFSHSILINAQTTETIAKKGFEFRIQHRFSEIDLHNFGESVGQDFLGFDGSANIRFSFAYALSNNLQIGIGRTKIDKLVDFDAKYRLLRQKETGVPISLTLYINAGIATGDFPEVGPGEFFADYRTPFDYKFSHRLSYSTQILISKKLGDNLALELNPTFIYKNLVPAGYDNFVAAATLGGRYKTGLNSHVIFEFSTKFNNRKGNFKDPISIGYEIGTAGHAFQFFVSNTNQIMEQNLYFSNPLDYSNGKFLLGFNIKRTFWRK